MNRIHEPVPGMRLITLPLPFELEHVNVALVNAADGYVLIDTGMAGDHSFEVLESALSELNVRWSEIHTIVATHIHPDHIGSAPRVIAASGARLVIHRAEFDYLTSILHGETPWVELAFVAGGVPGENWEIIRKSLKGMRGALPLIEPSQLLDGGEEIPTSLGAARVIPTPGHSSGHICLYWADQKLLYSGDHMIQTITPNISWMPGRDMLGEYLASLVAVAELDIELVISSHGQPFTDHREWVKKTRAHHEARCAEIQRHLNGTPRTAFELVPVLWNRDFSSFHFYFALFEVLAHLEHMERRQSVRFDVDGNGAKRWSSTAESALAAQ